jgi:hypothetical protein
MKQREGKNKGIYKKKPFLVRIVRKEAIRAEERGWEGLPSHNHETQSFL